jgi:hypothetical protein
MKVVREKKGTSLKERKEKDTEKGSVFIKEKNSQSSWRKKY